MITICSISARVKEFMVIGFFDDEVTDVMYSDRDERVILRVRDVF